MYRRHTIHNQKPPSGSTSTPPLSQSVSKYAISLQPEVRSDHHRLKPHVAGCHANVLMPNSDLISRSIFLNSFPYYHCLPPAAHPPFCCCRPQRMQAREKIENVCVCTIHCCAGAEELAPVANWIQTNNKRANRQCSHATYGWNHYPCTSKRRVHVPYQVRRCPKGDLCTTACKSTKLRGGIEFPDSKGYPQSTCALVVMLL